MGETDKIQLTNEKLIGNGSFGVVFQVRVCLLPHAAVAHPTCAAGAAAPATREGCA